MIPAHDWHPGNHPLPLGRLIVGCRRKKELNCQNVSSAQMKFAFQGGALCNHRIVIYGISYLVNSTRRWRRECTYIF